jgi:hypothetical protein
MLGGVTPTDYGAVLTGRINALTTSATGDVGATSGTSTAITDETAVSSRSPNHALVARDLSVELTAASGGAAVRAFAVVVNSTPPIPCAKSSGARRAAPARPPVRAPPRHPLGRTKHSVGSLSDGTLRALTAT